MIIQMSEYRAALGRLPENGGQPTAVANTAPVVVWLSNRARKRADAGLPEDAAMVDVHALLDRIYALATQI